MSKRAPDTKQIDNSVVVTGEKSNKVFEQHHKAGVDDAVVQLCFRDLSARSTPVLVLDDTGEPYMYISEHNGCFVF